MYLKQSSENESYTDFERVFDQIAANGLRPTHTTHVLRFHCLIKLNQFDKAMQYYEANIKSKNAPQKYKHTDSKLLAQPTSNLFIRLLFNINDESKAVQVFKDMLNSQIKPTSQTYTELISGYLTLKQYNNAFELYKNATDRLQSNDFARLYERLVTEYHKENNETLKKMYLSCVANLTNTTDNEFRVQVVDQVGSLLMKKHNNDAFFLVNTLFGDEYRTVDIVARDQIFAKKINVAEYFCKYLVKTNDSMEEIRKYQQLMDASFKDNQYYHLKMMAYSALSNLNESVEPSTAMCINIFEEFQKQDIPIGTSSFHPLIVHYLKKILDQIKAKKIHRATRSEYWGKMKELLELMTKHFGIILTNHDIESLINLFSDCNSLDFIRADLNIDIRDLVALMPSTVKHKLLVSSFMRKAFEANLKKISKKEVANDYVASTFDTFLKLFKTSKNTFFDLNMSRFFLVYFMDLEKKGLLKKYYESTSVREDKVLSFIHIINYRNQFSNIEASEPLKRINECFMAMYFKYKLLPQNDKQKILANGLLSNELAVAQLVQQLNFIQLNYSCIKALRCLIADNQSQMSPIQDSKLNYLVDKLEENFYASGDKHCDDSTNRRAVVDMNHLEKWNEETIDELEILLEELRAKGKPIYPCIRRLLMNLCNQKFIGSDSLRNRVYKLETELPDKECTMPVYASLMFYYSKHDTNLEKSTFYFNKLIQASDKMRSNFDIDPHKVIWHIEVCLKNNVPFDEIVHKLNQFKFDTQFKYMRNPIAFFVACTCDQLSATQLEQLVQLLEDRGYSFFYHFLCNYVVFRHLKENQVDSAFRYFKSVYATHKQVLFEVDLMKDLLIASNFVLSESPQVEFVLRSVVEAHGEQWAYTTLVFALIKANQFEKAKIILEKNMKAKLVTDVFLNYFEDLNACYGKYRDLLVDTEEALHAFWKFLGSNKTPSEAEIINTHLKKSLKRVYYMSKEEK